jgi:putative endonuclease
MIGYVYILQSEKDKSYYVGSTTDVSTRLKTHNSGGVKSTKGKRPHVLVFSQEFKDTKEARLYEMKIKSWKRRDFVEKIVKDGRIKIV